MTGQSDDVEAFRARARAFVEANLRRVDPVEQARVWGIRSDEEELAEVAREREIQRMLFDAGLAGICVPVAYGGQGLTPAHQQALNDVLGGYEWASRIQVPTFTPCMAVLLEFGTEEQKLAHVPAMLRGEEIWMQFLSEPSGGSDVAGALTTAVRDGDEWVLNGSKVWTTGAWWSDWGLCLARTNWDVPKHRGLSVFMFPIDQQGIEVQRIEMLNGSQEFCQEFLTDVRIPDEYRIGEVDDGWTVGTRWMFHERMSYNSPYATLPAGSARAGVGGSLALEVAREAGTLGEPRALELIGEAEMLEVVTEALGRRITEGLTSGTMNEQSSAIGRLWHGRSTTRRISIEFDVAGAAGAAWSDADGAMGTRGLDYLVRQVSCIGGGTTEMAANVISERVLGMPREASGDRGIPFRDVPRSPS